MGYTKAPTIHTLDKIKGEDGLVVRLKSLKVGKLRKLVRALDNEKAGLSEVLDDVFSLMVESAVSWNVQEDGSDVPFDLAGLEDLELDTVLAIMNAWVEKMTGPDEELGKDSTSGEAFPGQPLTMEAL